MWLCAAQWLEREELNGEIDGSPACELRINPEVLGTCSLAADGWALETIALRFHWEDITIMGPYAMKRSDLYAILTGPKLEWI